MQILEGPVAVKPPRQFYQPLAIGAPAPLRELPVRLERMIHFVPPHIEKMRAKVPELVRQVDVVLGNLEDAIPIEAKEAAREGFIDMAKDTDFGSTGLWVRVNALNSPWALDDIIDIVGEVGEKLDVVMLPKVDGPWDIHYLDQLLAQLESFNKHQEADPDPRHSGDGARRQQCGGDRHRLPAHARHEPRPRRSRRLARHEDHARRRRPSGLQSARQMQKATRRARPISRTCGTTPSRRWSTPAPPPASSRSTDPSAISPTPPPARRNSATPSSWAVSAPGRCIRRRSTIAKRVFSPDPAEVAFAKKIVDAMPDGAGAVMIDGKMQDDATWKQAKVLLDLAKQVAAKDPEMAARYAL